MNGILRILFGIILFIFYSLVWAVNFYSIFWDFDPYLFTFAPYVYSVSLTFILIGIFIVKKGFNLKLFWFCEILILLLASILMKYNIMLNSFGTNYDIVGILTLCLIIAISVFIAYDQIKNFKKLNE